MATKKITDNAGRHPLPRTFSNRPFYGMELDADQLAFADAIISPNIDIVFCNARAGTGKTTVATGAANMLVQCGEYDKLIYIMSPYGEKKQGWLPGSITEKSSVYFEAFYQALITCNINPQTAITNESMTNMKNGEAYITCITDTFLRGSNLDCAVIIIDEAQNYSTQQLKTVLTRIGNNAKVIVIGHELQCDLDKPETSGFMKYLRHFKSQPKAAICKLTINHRGWISRHADELE